MSILMIGLIVLAALLALLLFCRIGVLVSYSADGLTIRARLGWLKLTLFPPPERKPGRTKTPKRRKKRKTVSPPPEQAAPNTWKALLRGGSLSQLKALLALVSDTAGNAIRQLRVEELRLHYTFAGQPDPARAALECGAAQIGGDVIGHLLEQKVKIVRRQVTAEVDFCSEQGRVFAAGSCSIRVGAALVVTARLCRAYLKWKERQSTEAAQEEKTYG